MQEDGNVQEEAPSPPARTTSAPPQEDKALLVQDDPETRVLRFGDLVRVSDYGQAKNIQLRDDRGVGKVVHVHAVDEEPSSSFLYDISWILGGKSSKVPRDHLLHTTATQEGLTEGSTQRRNKKRPQSFLEYVQQPSRKKKANASSSNSSTSPSKASVVTEKKANKTAGPKGTQLKSSPTKANAPVSDKKKPSAKHSPKKKTAVKGKPTTSKKKLIKPVSKKGTSKKSANTQATKKIKTAKNTTASLPNPILPSSEKTASEENSKFSEYILVDKHSRELTRCLTKIMRNGPNFDWSAVQRKMDLKAYQCDRRPIEQQRRWKLLGDYYQQHRGITDPSQEIENPLRCVNRYAVDWDGFRRDVEQVVQTEDEEEKLWAENILNTIDYAKERNADKHEQEMVKADDVPYFLSAVQIQNKEAAMQSWRQQPFPERKYERLSKDAVCGGLSELDEKIAQYELETNLPDSFIGMSYRYDDTGQSEAWMKSVVDETGVSRRRKQSKIEEEAAMAIAADEGVIRAQVTACIQSLIIRVQDNVLTDRGVLSQEELRSANWETTTSEPQIVEQPVWGIDCYTRTHVIHVLELEFDRDTALEFVEKWLLPAINACPVDLAHDIEYPARILEGLSLEEPSKTTGDVLGDGDPGFESTHSFLGDALQRKMKTHAPVWLKGAANLLRRARAAVGLDFFRVHPKGHGSVVLSSKIPANTLVTFYRGELYPSWRWGEKMDAIEITQQRKQLKPNLPDFYNMALERPQSDPRGYGLLFVDASRKGGHGSQLSHSCDPTCEVRVAARNGRLCLAMTTLRELETGDELTFDYNAVTESLNEYQSAVCLCGYDRCRGSFLHFATADCYQQVLNRNAPIAARFSNLVKGSMKKVMSEDDENTLKSHGFCTAAFGAISVNRHCDPASTDSGLSDTMTIVPIWLRTYVSDVLRYIEYERRALPIALICNKVSTGKRPKKKSSGKVLNSTSASRPAPSFAIFRKHERKSIDKFCVSKEGLKFESKFKAALHLWNSLPKVKKDKFVKIASDEFQKQKTIEAGEKCRGKNKKAKGLTEEGNRESFVTQMSFQDADAEGVSAMEQRIQQLTQSLSRVGRVLDRHRENLVAAGSTSTDAESLMGAVHSPIRLMTDAEYINWVWNCDTGLIKSLISALPGLNLTSQKLMDNLNGVVSTYSHFGSIGLSETGNSTRLRKDIQNALLEMVDTIRKEVKRLSRLQVSLVSLRRQTKKFESMIKNAEAAGHDLRYTAASKDVAEEEDSEDRSIVQNIVSEMVDSVERKNELTKWRRDLMLGKEKISIIKEENPTLDFLSESFQLNVAGDVLLMYAHTKNFFILQPYETLKSSPVEVYAREIGNHVPKNIVDGDMDDSPPYGDPVSHETNTPSDIPLISSALMNDTPLELESSKPIVKTSEESTEIIKSLEHPTQLSDDSHDRGTQTILLDHLAGGSSSDDTPTKDCSLGVHEDGTKLTENSTAPASLCSSNESKELCDPSDIISNVTIEYRGDYVLSQLLQWYNGGIGQKQGLPELLGCTRLPDISGCLQWRQNSQEKPISVEELRMRLVKWFQDPLQRGSPWPDEIRKFFVSHDQNSSDTSIPFGSPIIDFLATGDESSIQSLLGIFDTNDSVSSGVPSDNLLASVDKGRPAQAVCNWVQCDKPNCGKWRKVAWQIDMDTLPEVFHCEDNNWDSLYNNCEAPQEDWDGNDKLVGKDGKVEGSPFRTKNEILSPDEEESFTVGAKFDVCRKFKNGMMKYVVASVVRADFSGKQKQVQFHFVKTSNNRDEWVEFGSDRIKPLFSESLKNEFIIDEEAEKRAEEKRREKLAQKEQRQKELEQKRAHREAKMLIRMQQKEQKLAMKEQRMEELAQRKAMRERREQEIQEERKRKSQSVVSTQNNNAATDASRILNDNNRPPPPRKEAPGSSAFIERHEQEIQEERKRKLIESVARNQSINGAIDTSRILNDINGPTPLRNEAAGSSSSLSFLFGNRGNSIGGSRGFSSLNPFRQSLPFPVVSQTNHKETPPLPENRHMKPPVQPFPSAPSDATVKSAQRTEPTPPAVRGTPSPRFAGQYSSGVSEIGTARPSIAPNFLHQLTLAADASQRISDPAALLRYLQGLSKGSSTNEK